MNQSKLELSDVPDAKREKNPCESLDQKWRKCFKGRVHLGNSGIRIYFGIYSEIYSGYSAPESRIAGMEIQIFRNENSSQTNAYLHYSDYSYSGLIPNERALKNIKFPRGNYQPLV